MCLKFSFQANIASLLIFFYFVIDVYQNVTLNTLVLMTRLEKYYLNDVRYGQNAYICRDRVVQLHFWGCPDSY